MYINFLLDCFPLLSSPVLIRTEISEEKKQLLWKLKWEASPEERVRIAETLGELKDDNAAIIQGLANASLGVSWRVNYKALEALATINTSKSISKLLQRIGSYVVSANFASLVEVLNNPKSTLPQRLSALINLGRIRDRRAVKILCDILLNRKECWQMQAVAAEALAEFGFEAVEALKKALENCCWRAKPYIVQSLGRIFLLHTLALKITKNPIYKDALQVKQICQNHKALAEGVVNVLIKAIRENNCVVGKYAAGALAMIKDEQGLPILLKVFRSADLNFRKHIAMLVLDNLKQHSFVTGFALFSKQIFENMELEEKGFLISIAREIYGSEKGHLAGFYQIYQVSPPPPQPQVYPASAPKKAVIVKKQTKEKSPLEIKKGQLLRSLQEGLTKLNFQVAAYEKNRSIPVQLFHSFKAAIAQFKLRWLNKINAEINSGLNFASLTKEIRQNVEGLSNLLKQQYVNVYQKTKMYSIEDKESVCMRVAGCYGLKKIKFPTPGLEARWQKWWKLYRNSMYREINKTIARYDIDKKIWLNKAKPEEKLALYYSFQKYRTFLERAKKDLPAIVKTLFLALKFDGNYEVLKDLLFERIFPRLEIHQKLSYKNAAGLYYIGSKKYLGRNVRQGTIKLKQKSTCESYNLFSDVNVHEIMHSLPDRGVNYKKEAYNLFFEGVTEFLHQVLNQYFYLPKYVAYASEVVLVYAASLFDFKAVVDYYRGANAIKWMHLANKLFLNYPVLKTVFLSLEPKIKSEDSAKRKKAAIAIIKERFQELKPEKIVSLISRPYLPYDLPFWMGNFYKFLISEKTIPDINKRRNVAYLLLKAFVRLEKYYVISEKSIIYLTGLLSLKQKQQLFGDFSRQLLFDSANHDIRYFYPIYALAYDMKDLRYYIRGFNLLIKALDKLNFCTSVNLNINPFSVVAQLAQRIFEKNSDFSFFRVAWEKISHKLEETPGEYLKGGDYQVLKDLLNNFKDEEKEEKAKKFRLLVEKKIREYLDYYVKKDGCLNIVAIGNLEELFVADDEIKAWIINLLKAKELKVTELAALKLKSWGINNLKQMVKEW